MSFLARGEGRPVRGPGYSKRKCIDSHNTNFKTKLVGPQRGTGAPTSPVKSSPGFVCSNPWVQAQRHNFLDIVC
jgi:hypothetical protein